MGLTEADLSVAGVGLQIGVEPGRIDVLTQISGVAFETAWAGRVSVEFAGVSCSVIGIEQLLHNKRTSARPQDLADVTALERLIQVKDRGDK